MRDEFKCHILAIKCLNGLNKNRAGEMPALLTIALFFVLCCHFCLSFNHPLEVLQNFKQILF